MICDLKKQFAMLTKIASYQSCPVWYARKHAMYTSTLFYCVVLELSRFLEKILLKPLLQNTACYAYVKIFQLKWKLSENEPTLTYCSGSRKMILNPWANICGFTNDLLEIHPYNTRVYKRRDVLIKRSSTEFTNYFWDFCQN